jgi:nucleolar protein 53
VLAHPKDVIELAAVTEPHQGTSYNPVADAHQELLLKAHEIEERRVKEQNRLAEVKQKIEQARVEEPGHVDEGCASGMVIDRIQVDEDDHDTEVVREPKKATARKTKAQRNKAAKLLAEVNPPCRRVFLTSDLSRFPRNEA